MARMCGWWCELPLRSHEKQLGPRTCSVSSVHKNAEKHLIIRAASMKPDLIKGDLDSIRPEVKKHYEEIVS